MADATQPSPNRAAFAAADVRDAKRGAPASDLRGYAAQRGLGFYDRVTIAGYRAAMPASREDQFNVMLGTLPGGEHGVLFHAALGVPVFNGSLAWSGTFHGVHLRSGRFKLGRALMEMVPVVGELVTQPGAGQFAPARAPTTVAAVRLPESVGVQPRLRLDRQGNAPPFDFGNAVPLDDVALPGWRAQSEPRVDAELLRELVAEPVAGALRAHDGDGLFQILVWWGTLVVRRNGYLDSPDDLDELGRIASTIAARLRRACLARHQPSAFEEALPPPRPSPPHTGLPAGYDGEPVWPLWAMQIQERYGLTAEDAAAYHRAFPTSPVPGVARLVFRGHIAPLGREGRLVVHEEPHGARAAVLLAAPPGARPAAQGGVPLSDRQVYFDLRDGIACVWCLPSYWGGDALLRDLDGLLQTAAGVLSERLPA